MGNLVSENKKIDEAISLLLRRVGDDPAREGLQATPERFRKMWEDFFSGYQENPEEILSKAFEDIAGYQEMVLLKNVPFYSFCEHHLLPMVGVVHIAYLPKKRVVGISALIRLIDAYAKRLQIQEKMTAQITDMMMRCLEPRAVAVYIEAEHFCVRLRGVKREGVTMVTSSYQGEENSSQWQESFRAAIRLR